MTTQPPRPQPPVLAEDQAEADVVAVPFFVPAPELGEWANATFISPAGALANPFRRDGRPKFRLRPHDVEEFVGVVERYGAGHDSNLLRLIAATEKSPEKSALDIRRACGTCHLRAA